MVPHLLIHKALDNAYHIISIICYRTNAFLSALSVIAYKVQVINA